MITPDTKAARSAPVSPHVFLAGRPPIAEFISFVKRASAEAGWNGESASEPKLAADWRAANDRLRELEESEAGFADAPSLTPLPPAVSALADRVMAQPSFQRNLGVVPVKIAMVELDRLVVYQKQINLDQVEIIKRELGADPSLETIAKVALGLDRYQPPVRLMQSHDVFTFTCDSRDFRFLEPTIVNPEELPALNTKGVPARCVVLAVGFSPNCLGAFHVEGRLVLFNGTHRAYAMREIGFTHVPCVVQTITRPEEIELMAPKELSQRGDLYLKSRRPPLLKDYFDPLLRRIVPVTRNNRLIRVQLRIDQSEVPGV